jgi:hypothetical protein
LIIIYYVVVTSERFKNNHLTLMFIMTSELSHLVEELLGTNMQPHKGRSITPLNEARFARDIEQPWDAGLRREVYDSLKVVLSAVDSDGGISSKLYEENKFAINVVARDLAGLRFSSTANPEMFCYNQDREGKQATQQQAAEFSEDGRYGEAVDGSHVNIFDEGYEQSGFEGTLFDLTCDSDNLQTMRIFHQGHRNSLHIKTVDSEKLISEMRSRVASYEEGTKLPWTLTLDKSEYLGKIDDFNTRLQGKVEIVLIGEGDEAFPVVKIYEQPATMKDRLLSQADDLGLNLRSNRCNWGYFVSSDGIPMNGCRFYVDSAIEDRNYRSSDGEFIGDTIIMPHEKVGLELTFLKDYVAEVSTEK